MIFKSGIVLVFFIRPHLEALFPHDFIKPVQKIHVPVRAEQYPAHFLVVLNETEQIMFSKVDTPIEKRLREIDINKLTPMESMNILFELIKMLDK